VTDQLPTYTIRINAFEAGILITLVEGAEDRVKPSLRNIQNQLISIKKNVENDKVGDIDGKQ
jgi:hypothetical protein